MLQITLDPKCRETITAVVDVGMSGTPSSFLFAGNSSFHRVRFGRLGEHRSECQPISNKIRCRRCRIRYRWRKLGARIRTIKRDTKVTAAAEFWLQHGALQLIVCRPCPSGAWKAQTSTMTRAWLLLIHADRSHASALAVTKVAVISASGGTVRRTSDVRNYRTLAPRVVTPAPAGKLHTGRACEFQCRAAEQLRFRGSL